MSKPWAGGTVLPRWCQALLRVSRGRPVLLDFFVMFLQVLQVLGMMFHAKSPSSSWISQDPAGVRGDEVADGLSRLSMVSLPHRMAGSLRTKRVTSTGF